MAIQSENQKTEKSGNSKMNARQWVTLFTAIAGFLLGVFNANANWQEKRISGEIKARQNVFEVFSLLNVDWATGGIVVEKVDDLNRNKASLLLEEALQLDPNSADAHRLNGVLIQLEDTEKARESFKKALIIEPGNALIVNDLGNLDHKNNNFDSAIGHYKTALSLDPTLAVASFNLANTFKKNDMPEEAEQQFRETIRIDKQYLNAYFGLVAILTKGGDIDGAIGVCKRITGSWPLNIEAHSKQISLLEMQGRTKEASAIRNRMALLFGPISDGDQP